MARRRRKNKAALPIGIIVIVLAVIGLVTVITSAVGFIKANRDDAAEKAKYEEWLKPVVMFDPDTFDDINMADKSQLLYSAVWALLQDENGMSKYPYSQGETIGILVPQADIEKAFISLYGNEIDIASLHSSIDMSGYDITYDAAQKSYILPITGVEAAYTPQVISIEKQGTSTILNVGYIGGRAWADIEDGEYTAPEPDTNTQIISLENGMDNWFSTNLDITLEDLQSALVEATGGETSITINSQDCGFSTYVPGTSTWRGTLTTLDVSRMYMITVESSCEIVLEGMPVDPASYSVTIKPGYNWIGMTMSNNISLTDAFAGFAENGDQVISSTVTNTYERRRWGNQFTILEPGQGYIYYSAGSGDRTFVFPVSE